MDGERVMEGRERRKVRVCACTVCQAHTDRATIEYHQAINRVVVELNERGRRLFAGLLARQFGRGGVQRLSEISGLDRKTIRRGLREILQVGWRTAGRVRSPGGGRPAAEKKVLGC